MLAQIPFSKEVIPFIAIEHLDNSVSKILHRTEPSKFDSLFQLNDQHRGTIFLLSHRLPHSMQAPHAMRDPLDHCIQRLHEMLPPAWSDFSTALPT